MNPLPYFDRTLDIKSTDHQLLRTLYLVCFYCFQRARYQSSMSKFKLFFKIQFFNPLSRYFHDSAINHRQTVMLHHYFPFTIMEYQLSSGEHSKRTFYIMILPFCFTKITAFFIKYTFRKWNMKEIYIVDKRYFH